MDELNLHLQSLIQELCSYLPSSPQHRKTLNCLLRVILKSGRLWRPPAGDSYEHTLYEEALHKTMVKITKTLCEKYNPNLGSFLAWFNKCLENQYRDEIRATQRERSYRQPVWQSDELDIDPLDKVISPVDATLLLQTWESFVQWVTNDPDNILRSCHIANNPTANCQLLAHLRIVGGFEWQQIAAEVGSSRGAVTSHWCRKCEFYMRQWLDTNQRLFGEDSYDR
ncbi:MAG: sigma-70 family RNA polymerase sigma factor [Cyanomargarita calcarea GSE-NOS-MK-12-04C]|jgi:DNA-directed RNA polymerase specialized sigma24 family protein|uniref:Sigma-70 family RNA polymerase sigma factor n=1 Tax=Cyanomargarita calcarea GSE-NOS-MK-12-04C TaxID=2839659 RepID=A0A951USE5_9CYAN|nr:sigma-70 family RNA polymerase sigma factor [Cyanomargarita calcarea GSE-NOS-MK-12-04C]